MIVIQLSGNIGEQLFKYAAAKNFALIYNTSLLIDVSWFIKNKKAKLQLNKNSLTGFNTTFGMAGTVIINNFIKTKHISYLNRFPETAKYKIITENKREFTNALYSTNPPFYMIGDFKSEKYFEENINQIIDDFTVNVLGIKKISPIVKRIEIVESIGVLIESKYVNRNNTITKLEIDFNYIQKAIEHYESFVKNPHFIFFTDLNEEEINKLNVKNSKEIIPLFQNEMEWKNVFLMSKCKYFIANNSATAWWAAWLNFAPNRTVIIPQNFSFEYPEITHNKLGIQQNWIKI